MNKKEILNIISSHPKVEEGDEELFYQGFETPDEFLKSKKDIFDEIENIIKLSERFFKEREYINISEAAAVDRFLSEYPNFKGVHIHNPINSTHNVVRVVGFNEKCPYCQNPP
jgi:hypothetical protein